MEIHWQEYLIASVETEGEDFPTFFGRFTASDSAPDKIKSYIEFCVRTWPQIEEGNFTDEYYKEEEKFIDLIEESKWWLIDDQGAKHPILIPIFCTNSGVNWRLDPER